MTLHPILIRCQSPTLPGMDHDLSPVFDSNTSHSSPTTCQDICHALHVPLLGLSQPLWQVTHTNNIPQAVFMSRTLPRPEGPRMAILLGAYEWNGFCHPPVSPVITALGFVSVLFLFVSVLFSDFRASFSVLCFLILYVFLFSFILSLSLFWFWFWFVFLFLCSFLCYVSSIRRLGFSPLQVEGVVLALSYPLICMAQLVGTPSTLSIVWSSFFFYYFQQPQNQGPM